MRKIDIRGLAACLLLIACADAPTAPESDSRGRTLPTLANPPASLAAAPFDPSGAPRIQISGRTEYYYKDSDILSSIAPFEVSVSAPFKLALKLSDVIQLGCSASVGDIWGVKVKVDPGNGAPTVDFDATSAYADIVDLADKGAAGELTFNNVRQTLIPSLELEDCQPAFVRPMMHLSGGASTYAVHFGTGPYPKQIVEATHELSRTFRIENSSNSPVVQTIRVAGSLLAAESFGDDQENKATAVLTISGTIGNESFQLGDSIESVTIFPEQREVRAERTVIVAPGAGTFFVPVQIKASGRSISQAKSAGLIGAIAGSATSSVSFPGSFDVSSFGGPNGQALPTGVVVSDSASGRVFVDTRVYTGPPSIGAVATVKRDSISSDLVVTIDVRNSGVGDAGAVAIVTATLAGASSSTALPWRIGRLTPFGAASSARRSFVFPSTVGSRGQAAVLSIRGRHSAGSFGTDLRVVIP